MKKIINRILGVLLIAAVAVAMPLHSMNKNTRGGKVDPLEHVAKEVSLLDQIVEQAENVINAVNNKVRITAKNALKRLMNNKDLDAKIKKLISEDITTIQQSTDQAQEAYDHLLDVVAQINAQANVVAITQEATELIKNAPEAEKPGMMRWAYKKIQEATQAAQSMITTPVNYVFGEESSDAKTAFYLTAGALILYGGYQWGKNALDEKEKAKWAEIEKKRRENYEKWLNSPEYAKQQAEEELKRIAMNEQNALVDQIKKIRRQQEHIIAYLPSTKQIFNTIYWQSTPELDELEAQAQVFIKEWQQKNHSSSPFPLFQ